MKHLLSVLVISYLLRSQTLRALRKQTSKTEVAICNMTVILPLKENQFIFSEDGENPRDKCDTALQQSSLE